MLERFIHYSRAVELPDEPTPEQLAVAKSAVPAAAVRRMTLLGLMVGDALRDHSPREEDTIVYATCFSETRTLERYMEGFPTPSPQLFQTSIHPSAVEQVLIARNLPVDEFYPLAGSTTLVSSALQTALLATTPRVWLIGGEERGTWLRETDQASAHNYAFCLLLTANAEGAIGRISWTTDAQAQAHPETAEEACATGTSVPSLRAFFEDLSRRCPRCMATPEMGRLGIEWFA
ncbi:MAG: hypothetical protein SFY80_05975 [Verrucomicrobiota bacterium]|nr:hypothetical protein [Verrucomicrobiota bacterium]